MSLEGDTKVANAEPAKDDATSALRDEYTESVTLARADFSVTPDQPITRPAADTYYVNNGTQDWRAKPNADGFVPPADNKSRDPYFNPNATQPWRANPFEDGGKQFRRPGDPLVDPRQDTTDPRYRQTVPDQSFVPGYVAPNQQYTQFYPQYSPENNPRFISNNGVPAYSGLGFQFTNNFYNVGERPSLSGKFAYVPQGSDIPVVKIDTAFPGQKSFFGVPLTSSETVVSNPAVVNIPKADISLPVSTIPVKTIPVKFEPGVVPVADNKGVDVPVATEVAAPVTAIDPNKKANTDGLTLPAAQTIAGVEVRPIAPVGDPTVVVADPPQKTTLPFDSTLPSTSVLVPIEQQTQDRSKDVLANIRNETYRGTTTTVAGLTWLFSNKLPRDNQFLADYAAKHNWTVKPDPSINWSAKLRDPAGAIVGVNAYEWTAGGLNWLAGNSDWNSNSRVANVTVPLGIFAYRAFAPNVKSPGIAALATAGTFGATYIGDKIMPSMKGTSVGTHTGFDDVSMITGMYAANKIPMPGALTRLAPEALKTRTAGVFWKAGILTASFLGGNVIESGYNWLFGKEAIMKDATTALKDDSTTRTFDSLARARQKYSNLSDAQFSAARAEYATIKAESDTLNSGQNNWEQRAIADRKIIILAAAIGETYLNSGTQVTGQGNTFIGKGTDIDLNSNALIRLTEAREAAYRLIRKYNENVLPATINGTPVNKAAEVAGLQQEVQRIDGLLNRIYAPHNYEAAMPEFLKAAKDKPVEFFTNFVRANADMAARNEQDLKNRGLWDKPESAESRRIIAKMHRDRAFALLVIAQNALEVGAGREAVEALRGLPGSNEPTMNANSALLTYLNHFRALPERGPSEAENFNNIKRLYIKLNEQIKAKFPTIYPPGA